MCRTLDRPGAARHSMVEQLAEGLPLRDRFVRRTMVALAAMVSLAPAAACQATARNEPPKAAVEALKAAYYGILEFEKCVERAPDATDPRLAQERRRTTDLIVRARGKSLQPYLDQAAARWRHIDSVADKICYFQMTDFKGTSAALLREANDRFRLAIERV
jgi:hypothetical protein